MLWSDFILGSKAPIMTAADDKFWDTFLNFRKKNSKKKNDISWESSDLIVIFEKATKFEIVICCKL